MKLITLVQVSDAEEGEEAIIAKLLTVSTYQYPTVYENRRDLIMCRL